MNHLGSNQMDPNVGEGQPCQPMINGYTNFICGAVGAFYWNQVVHMDENGVITVDGVRYGNLGARTICRESCGNRWIVVTNTNPDWSAQGPFDGKQVVMNDVDHGVIAGIILDGKVEGIGLGRFCSDDHDSGSFWIIRSSTEGQSFQVPAVPTAGRVHLVPEVVEGDFFRASRVESDGLQAMQPTPDSGDHQAPTVPPCHEAAAEVTETGGVIRGDEFQGLATPPLDVNYVEGTLLHGDHAVVLEQELHSGAGKSQAEGRDDQWEGIEGIDWDAVDTLFEGLDEVAKTGPHSVEDSAADGADWGAPIVPTTHEAAGAVMVMETGVVSVDESGGRTEAALDANGLESWSLQGDHVGLAQHDFTHSGAGKFQSEGAHENNEELWDDDFSADLEKELDEVAETGEDCAADGADRGVPSTHEGGAVAVMESGVVLDQETGWGAAGESLSVGHVQSGFSFDEKYEMLGVDRDEVAQTPGPHSSLGCAIADGADCGAPIVPTSHGAPGSFVELLHDSTEVSFAEEGSESPSKRALMAEEIIITSPSSVLEDPPLNAAYCEAPVVSTSHEVAVPAIMATESNDNEGLASPVLGNFVPTPQQNDSEECLTQQSENARGVQMAGQMAGGWVATTSTNPSLAACQPSRKRPRKVKFPHHGASPRGGGRTSWKALFRPTGLPDSDKTFLTIGEFTNRSDAWHAFNLFALVHEGVQACIDPIDLDSLSVEAEYWGTLPRVELLAHLRLKGREHFARDNILPPDPKIPRYRNVKYWRGNDGKIRWMCDVALPKGVVDPKYVANASEKTCSFDTPEEAAREADRLMFLKEGIMAWTNYPVTDYMTEEEKEQWDPTWVPLQDNPKKYLQNAKV